MDLFIMVRRKKMSYFVDVKETTTVIELKKIIRGITKFPLDDIRLFRDDTIFFQPWEDDKSLLDLGFNSTLAKPQSPVTIGLTIRLEDGSFESLEISELSIPPDLPEVMKPQESTSSPAE